MTFSTKNETQHNNTQYYDNQHNSAEYNGLNCDTQHIWHSVQHSAWASNIIQLSIFNVMLCIILLSGIILIVFMLAIVVLSVVGPVSNLKSFIVLALVWSPVFSICFLNWSWRVISLSDFNLPSGLFCRQFYNCN